MRTPIEGNQIAFVDVKLDARFTMNGLTLKKVRPTHCVVLPHFRSRKEHYLSASTPVFEIAGYKEGLD